MRACSALVVAFLTFRSSNILHRYTIHLACFDIVVEFLVNAIELITCTVVVVEINLCLAVAVNAPAHAQFSHLLHPVHFLDISMAGLAGYISNSYVLCVVEINVVRKVMDLDPLR